MKIIFLTICLLLLASCSTWRKFDRTEKGAIIGGGTGAVLGSTVGGTTGTLLGGAAGAAAGGLIGHETKRD